MPLAGVLADLDPLVQIRQQMWTPLSADLDSPTKLSENIILDVLVKIDDTSVPVLEFVLIQNMRIDVILFT